MNVCFNKCYVMLCYVMLCTECKMTPKGTEYMGTVHTTETGRECQAWTSDIPWDHNYNHQSTGNFPDGSAKGARNYCRNPDPDHSVRPWCYTMTNERWEYCDVPMCKGLSFV